MAERVYLHVGLPKTGTTYLQEVLWTNVARLHEQGYTLAAGAHRQHSHAMGDLLGLPRGPRTEGAWLRQVRRVAAEPGAVIISQEQLSRATRAQAARAVESLLPAQTTVVVTARDPRRQLTSYWQQLVKFRHVDSLAATVAAIRQQQRSGEHEFWLQQDLLGVVDRWRTSGAGERVLVVTVPPRGAAPDELWRRFATACGLDGAGFDLDVQYPNESLGATQVELLRRVNAALGDRLTETGAYALVRRLGANALLASQRDYTSIRLDEAASRWARELGSEWAKGLRARGVRIVGDVSDLVPTEEPEISSATSPDAATDETAVNAAAVELIIGLLEAGASGAMAKPASGRLGIGGARRREAAP